MTNNPVIGKRRSSQHDVGLAVDPGDGGRFNRDAASGQGRPLRIIRRERVVQEERDATPIRQHQCMMQRQRACGEHADIALIEL